MSVLNKILNILDINKSLLGNNVYDEMTTAMINHAKMCVTNNLTFSFKYYTITSYRVIDTIESDDDDDNEDIDYRHYRKRQRPSHWSPKPNLSSVVTTPIFTEDEFHQYIVARYNARPMKHMPALIDDIKRGKYVKYADNTDIIKLPDHQLRVSCQVILLSAVATLPDVPVSVFMTLVDDMKDKYTENVYLTLCNSARNIYNDATTQGQKYSLSYQEILRYTLTEDGVCDDDVDYRSHVIRGYGCWMSDVIVGNVITLPSMTVNEFAILYSCTCEYNRNVLRTIIEENKNSPFAASCDVQSLGECNLEVSRSYMMINATAV